MVATVLANASRPYADGFWVAATVDATIVLYTRIHSWSGCVHAVARTRYGIRNRRLQSAHHADDVTKSRRPRALPITATRNWPIAAHMAMTFGNIRSVQSACSPHVARRMPDVTTCRGVRVNAGNCAVPQFNREKTPEVRVPREDGSGSR
jgi:hypothetical protein